MNANSTGTSKEPRRFRPSDNDRGAWSSDAPRRRRPGSRDNAPQRVRVNTARHSRVLRPDDNIAYPRVCLVVIAGPDGAGRAEFANRLFPTNTVLSLEQMRTLIGGDSPRTAVQAEMLLKKVVTKRLEGRRLVVVDAAALTTDERLELVQLAQEARRSAHLVLLDAPAKVCEAALRDAGCETDETELQVQADDLAATRKLLLHGDLGREGFSSVLLLTPAVAAKVHSVTLGRINPDD